MAYGMDTSRFDFSVGAGWAFSADTVFSDENCASVSPAAYFGCGAGSDGRPLGAYGDFGDTPVLDLGIGYTVNDWLHTELLLAYRPGLAFSGNSNFIGAPATAQFVDADVRNFSAMAAANLKLAPLLGMTDGPIQPFLTAGAGLSHNRIDQMVYRFPTLDPAGSTITRSGDSTEFTWMAGGGVDMSLSEDITASLLYRYIDLGKVRTEPGNIQIIRDGRVDVFVPVNETRARLSASEFMVRLRYGF